MLFETLCVVYKKIMFSLENKSIKQTKTNMEFVWLNEEKYNNMDDYEIKNCFVFL